MGNWFRPKSYTKQNYNVGRVPCKKPYSIWIENKKVIQKINWVDKLETPCTHLIKIIFNQEIRLDKIFQIEMNLLI